MLVAIDLQNDIFHTSGSGYAQWTEKVKDGIEKRLEKAVSENESIIYTRNLYPDFEHEKRGTESIRFDESVYSRFDDLLNAHGDEYVKTFYGIPPEEARKLQQKYLQEVETNQTIEFVGAETNICVLANIMVIQNIFPHADITINKKLVASTSDDMHDKTLEILANMNVIIT